MPSFHRPVIRDTFSIAGWLFADLLLGLAMLFLVFNTVGSSAALIPTPTVTRTPTLLPTTTANVTTPVVLSPTATPQPTRTPTLPPAPTEQIGLDTEAYQCVFTLDPDGLYNDRPTVISQMRAHFDRCFESKIGTRVAGAVITLGYHSSTNSGYSLATRVNQELAATYPEMFTGSVMRSFGWYSSSLQQQGLFQIDVYFYSLINNPSK